MRRSHAAFLAVALLTCALPLPAARVRRLPLTELRDRAAVVIVGEVTASSSRLGQADMVWTDYQVRVVETLKGDTQPSIKTLSFAGGKYGDYEVGIDGVPQLEQGRTYVFFLKANPGMNPTPTLGFGQGVYQVTESELSGKRQQLLVSYDGEPLELNAAGEMVRGRMVAVSGDTVREMQSAAPGNRATRSGFVRADGSIGPAPVTNRVVAAAAPRRFASLAQLRDFVSGKLASGERADAR